MKQPIAGVAPSVANEVTIITVWPSICAYPTGQLWGRIYSIRWPNVYIFRLGNLFALLSIPYALFLYFCRIAPKIGTRYRVTNRRITIQRGLQAVEAKAIAFEQFDKVRIDVLPGQAWYHAGDVVFCRQDEEVFRLAGVSRPEAFRQICLKSHTAYLSVQRVRQQQAASA